MTNEIQQFRYDQLMRRVNGIIGPGSKVSEVLTELFPVLDVEQLPAELLWLSDFRLAFGGVAVLADAGETPRIQLFNPVGSGKLVTIEGCVVSVSTGGSVLWTTTNVLFPDTVAPQRLRDTRSGAFEAPSTQIRTFSAVGTTVATNRLVVAVNVPFHFENVNSIAVLFPGTGFEVGFTALASTLSVSFNWRERVFERSELTGI